MGKLTPMSALDPLRQPLRHFFSRGGRREERRLRQETAGRIQGHRTGGSDVSRHGEEQSDEAIQNFVVTKLDCFANARTDSKQRP